MKFSKKILVSTVSDIVITVVGFFGTLYFARVLGAGPIGTFALGLTIVQIFLLFDLGVGAAAMKRISGDNDPDGHFSAALVVYGFTLAVGLVFIFSFQEDINRYVGGEFAVLLAAIFTLHRLYQMLNAGIKGRGRVYIRDTIDATEELFRVIAQALLVFAGFQTLSLFLGYTMSLLIAVLLAFAYHVRHLSFTLTFPTKDHFWGLYTFARYSWLYNFKSLAFSWIDITVLGFFVANSEIGIYQISWTLAMTFQIVGKSIGRNLFPEISNIANTDRSEQVQEITQESFVFAGLIPIPGIVGSLILGENVLQLYGQTFVEGALVLAVLAVVSTCRAYEGSIYALTDGLDRPRISFIGDFIFIFLNIILNVMFVSMFGILGAGIATAIALGTSLGVAGYLARRHVDFSYPYGETGTQIVAALLMGLIIVTAKSLLDPISFVETISLVIIGASIYFSLVLLLSDLVRSRVLELIARMSVV